MAKTLTDVKNFQDSLVRPSMNQLRVASAVKNGETITIGSTVFEVWTGGTLTAGRTAIDLSAAPTAAAAALVYTFAANPTAADTVTIDGVVYTYRASVTTTANEVLIGATLTDTRNNLVAAINGADGGGTTYGSATVANPRVAAVATSTNAVTASARAKGTNGNAIAVAEAGAQTSWAGGAVALTGGVDPTAAEAIPAIILAVNGVRCGLRASAGGANDILFTSSAGTGAAVTTTETLAGTNNAWAAAASYGGTQDTSVLNGTVLAQRAANATEVALGSMRFPFNFTPLAAIATVRTAAGAFKAFDGVLTISGNTVVVDNSGSSDWADTDLMTVLASF